jgi:hypothetical protein
MLNIPLNQISLNYQNYSISSNTDFFHLKNDIIKNGLFVPVVVTQKNKSFFLISGFKRFNIFQELSITEIPAIVKKFDSVSDILKFIITDNMRYRNLSETELMNAVVMLSKYFNDDYNFISEILNIKKGYCKNYNLMSKLPKDILKLFDDNLLFVGLSPQYLNLIEKGFLDLVRFFADNKINKNIQKNMMSYIFEIQLRDEISTSDLLNIINFYNISISDKFNIYKKKDTLYKHLYSLRYPNLNSSKQKFNFLLNKFIAKSKIKCFPPENFEGDYIKFEFKLKKNEEILHIISVLEKMYSSHVIENAIDSFI